VYKAYLLLFLILFCACDHADPPEITNDYGDVYFHIGCYWPDPIQVLDPAVWRCFENVETELLSGFLYLELESSTSLYFCGENLTLRSDKQKGNEFDWVWEEDINTLQIIWRPDDDPHKMITLVIKEEEYNQVTRSTAYYKILN
jgi:hypothetical protein